MKTSQAHARENTREASFVDAIEAALIRKNAESSTAYKQYHFAQDVGVSESFMSKVRSGLVLPGMDTLRAMEHVLELAPDTLVKLADEERRRQADVRNARRQELARLALAARESDVDEPDEQEAAEAPSTGDGAKSAADPKEDSALMTLLVKQMEQLQKTTQINTQLLEEIQKLREEVSAIKKQEVKASADRR